MKCLLVPTLALLASPVLAATIPHETQGQCGEQIAVASACVVNTTEYTVAFDSQWGIGDAWSRLWLAPGDQGLYRLVLPASQAGVQLAVRYPSDAAADQVYTLDAPAVWATQRVDDCAKLMTYDLVQHAVDGGAPAFDMEVAPVR